MREMYKVFAEKKNYLTREFHFNWNADYNDGSSYSEYDLETGKKNDYYSIEQSKVLRFGLFGQNMKLFFEMVDGSFNINGRRVEIEFHSKDGEVHYLTSNFKGKDLITYKDASVKYNNIEGLQQSIVDSINFGYKTIYSKDELELFFQPIINLPSNDNAFISVKMTPNKNIEGHLVFKTRGVEIERVETSLEANNSYQINWNIKG